MTQDVQKLLDKQACVELVYGVARGLDRCDEALIRQAFHTDATDDHGQFKGNVDEFVAWVFPLLRTMERTQHLIGNILVQPVGDVASAESYVVASHDMADRNGRPIRLTVAGRYLDRFERRQGEWRIAHRTFISDWSASEPRSDVWDRQAGTTRIYGSRDRQDRSYAEGAVADPQAVAA